MTTDPWAIRQWAFEVVVGNSARKSLFMVLAGLANYETGRCEVKIDTLMRWTELGESTIQRHLTALVGVSLIARRPQYRVDGSQRSTEYLMLAPWIEAWPDGESVDRGSRCEAPVHERDPGASPARPQEHAVANSAVNGESQGVVTSPPQSAVVEGSATLAHARPGSVTFRGRRVPSA